MLLRPKMGRKKDPLEGAGSRVSLSQQRAVERDMNNLVVELSEMARQITAQLDTRSAKLEALLREADRRIEQLSAIERSARQMPIPKPVESRQLPPPGDGLPSDPRHQVVYDLATEGHNAHDIAQRLGRPAGEVELILALRPNRGMS